MQVAVQKFTEIVQKKDLLQKFYLDKVMGKGDNDIIQIIS